MLKTIGDMLTRFDADGIRYCHWKSNEHLEAALEGETDLDVLFDPEQKNLVEKALREIGLKRFLTVPLMAYKGIEDYLGFDQEQARIWHLHLHWRLALGSPHLKEYTLPWNEALLERSSRNPEAGIFCIHPADEILLLLVRMALKLGWRDLGKAISPHDRTELDWLMKRASVGQATESAKKLLGAEISNEVQRILETGLNRRKELMPLQNLLRKALRPYAKNGRGVSFLRRTRREVSWVRGGLQRRAGLSSLKPSRRIPPSGGIVVAILGCDGAGKSTTISYLKREFGKKVDVYAIYMGSGDGSSSFLRRPMKGIARRLGGRGLGLRMEQEMSERMGNELSTSHGLSLKYQMYALAKVIWGVALALEKQHKLQEIYKARNAGLLVLADRYPQTEVMGCSDGPLLNTYRKGPSNWLRHLAEWEYRIYDQGSIQPPDLLIKLTVPTEVALQRKPEMMAEEIQRKKDAVRRIRFSGESVEIDTSQPFQASLGQVMRAIWEVL